ncbi:MAG TPA: DUF488 domain-containing protein [Anaerolineae bacterium]|nr:DUF488 domain-containing protein [Anaerolineae bacterium]
MTRRVYTIGYAGRDPYELADLAVSLDAVIFDIRYSPLSRNSRWNLNTLKAICGYRYQHIPALGNRNYKSGPIALVDYDAGRRQILASSNPVILLCACKNPATCHRTLIAQRLREDGFSVEEWQGPLKGPVQMDLWNSTP